MRVCVVSLTDPWRKRDGGTIRTRAVIDALTGLGHETTVAYLGAASRPPDGHSVLTIRAPVDSLPAGERFLGRSWLGKTKRQLLPLPTAKGAWVPALAGAVRAARPDLVYVSELRAAPYATAHPDARLWLDFSDLWSTLMDAEVSSRKGLPRLTAGMQQRVVARSEARWLDRAAVITAAGYADALAAEAAGGGCVRWLPVPVAAPGVEAPATGRRVAGLLANFRFWPNRDAFTVLTETWAPELARLGWSVVAAGLGSETLERSPHVEILGEVEDVRDFYAEVDLTLAPIRLGGGIKVKIIESLVYGRPVVATPYALRGFPPDLASRIPTTSAARPDFAGIDQALAERTDLARLARDAFSPVRFRESVAAAIGAVAS